MERMHIPEMILIGGLHRNAGKTTLSARILAAAPGTITAVKVTVFRGAHANETSPVLLAEERPDTGKDTSRLLAAGAARVFWLRTDEAHMPRALSLLDGLRDGGPLLVESNTLRLFVEPSLFYLVSREGDPGAKESATRVRHLADRILTTRLDEAGEVVYTPLPRVAFSGGKWIELS